MGSEVVQIHADLACLRSIDGRWLFVSIEFNEMVRTE
jgi:hypothetical protein